MTIASRPIWALTVILTLAMPSRTSSASTPLYTVVVESGERLGSDGTRTDYLLYVPQRTPGLSGPPWPAVVLTHGFARDLGRLTLSAMYLAQRGIIVLSPNMPSLFGGQPSRDTAIRLTTEHLRWLIRRGQRVGDSLYKLVDPKRLALAGHSAGGAVSLEAAHQSQVDGVPLAGVTLLDAVPWETTIVRAAALSPISIISLRAPGSACNADSSGSRIVAALAFASYDVLLEGATHCDAEAPTDITCALVCGGTSVAPHELFQRLTYLFLRDVFGMQALEPGDADLDETLRMLEAEGRLQVLRAP